MLLGALVAFALFAFMFTLTSPGGDEQRLSEVLKDPWATLGCAVFVCVGVAVGVGVWWIAGLVRAFVVQVFS